MNDVLITVAVLGLIGLVMAVILYFVSQKFKVYEDPKIGEVESVLPGANCGGCGFPGCHGMAQALASAESLEGLNCPVGGPDVMKKIAEILGKTPVVAAKKISVVRCAGCVTNRPKKINYDGAKSCAVENSHFTGETDCSFGCLGFGECVDACDFGAIEMGEDGLPHVNEDICGGCGQCVKACPKQILELRPQGPKGRRLYVSCVNRDKGAAVVKACKVSCIGCGKCVKECKFDAIHVENNVAYIDYNKCKLCRKCEAVCPRKSIVIANWEPLPKPKPEEAPAAAPAAAPVSNEQKA